MDQSSLLTRIRETFPEVVYETHSRLGQDTAIINKSGIVELARFLKEDDELKFNILVDLTAVDYWKKHPRFEVVYHFLSLENKFRLRVKVPVKNQIVKSLLFANSGPGQTGTRGKSSTCSE